MTGSDTILRQAYLDGHPASDLARWQRAMFFQPLFENAAVEFHGEPYEFGSSFANRYADGESGRTAKFHWNFAPGDELHLGDVTVIEGSAEVWESFGTFERYSKTLRGAQYFSQSQLWPHRIVEGVDESALAWYAVASDRPKPTWPAIGIAMPTLNGSSRTRDAALSLARFYPGRTRIAVVDNGSVERESQALRRFATELPQIITYIRLESNLGYGPGCNAGLDALWQDEWFDLFGVSNDDLIPSAHCLTEIARVYQELSALGHRPGIVGPVSNRVHGGQLVEIGAYNTVGEMLDKADQWHLHHHSGATQVAQVRGLLWLQSAECLNDVGGFDPVFGLGNFEDDDLNVRARLAGYSLWIADGAFAHHEGSSTFRDLAIDYRACIERNLSIICRKWSCKEFAEVLCISENPSGQELYIPLSHRLPSSGYITKLGDLEIDLALQATEAEFLEFVGRQLAKEPIDSRIRVLRALAQAPESTVAA